LKATTHGCTFLSKSCANRNFDASLQSRDPSWGVRDLEAVIEAASREGLELKEKIEMPANNLSLIFQRKVKE
jgi:hypothetical protein